MAAVKTKPAIALVPDTRELRATTAQALSLLDAQVVGPSVEDLAQVLIVDGTQDSAVPQLEAALNRAGRPTVIALVHWTDRARFEALQALGVGDFVTSAQAEIELPFRLRRAWERHQSRIEAEEREKDLSFLLKLTADYAESLDAAELLHDVTRRLASEFNILRASLVVIDEEREAGFVIAASDDPSLNNLRIELSRYPEIREVVRTGKPVLVDEVPTHPLLEGVKTEVSAKGIHAIAALPLAIRGKVLGVLLLRASSRRAAFTSREMDMLATVAHATAIALRNARLIEFERGQTAKEKSARVAAEERAAQLQRYESYFANISEGIAILDDKALVLTLNPAGSKMLEVSAQDARGKHINLLTNPSDDGLMMDMLWSTLRGQVHREIDLAVRTGTGQRLILSVCAAPMVEGGAAAIVSFRDVTVQRELALELSKTKDFLERLIDSSVDAIIASDMKGKVILFNKGAEAVCGYSSAEALAKLTAFDLYPSGVAKEVMMRLRSTDEGGRGRLTVSRLEIISKNGERVPVNLTASILYDGEREIATVGIFTDLRARVQLERKLSDAETRLEESERSAVIVALAGTAAHELNQPLTSVMGYAELLKRKLTPADFAFRPVDIIYREAERMAEIVRKIGKITRYETKAYVGSSQILDLEKASSHEE